jgi:hypothetical protein
VRSAPFHATLRSAECGLDGAPVSSLVVGAIVGLSALAGAVCVRGPVDLLALAVYAPSCLCIAGAAAQACSLVWRLSHRGRVDPARLPLVRRMRDAYGVGSTRGSPAASTN